MTNKVQVAPAPPPPTTLDDELKKQESDEHAAATAATAAAAAAKKMTIDGSSIPQYSQPQQQEHHYHHQQQQEQQPHTYNTYMGRLTVDPDLFSLETNDPYTYSDDSESLSDAYFMTQHQHQSQQPLQHQHHQYHQHQHHNNNRPLPPPTPLPPPPPTHQVPSTGTITSSGSGFFSWISYGSMSGSNSMTSPGSNNRSELDGDGCTDDDDDDDNNHNDDDYNSQSDAGTTMMTYSDSEFGLSDAERQTSFGSRSTRSSSSTLTYNGVSPSSHALPSLLGNMTEDNDDGDDDEQEQQQGVVPPRIPGRRFFVHGRKNNAPQKEAGRKTKSQQDDDDHDDADGSDDDHNNGNDDDDDDDDDADDKDKKNVVLNEATSLLPWKNRGNNNRWSTFSKTRKGNTSRSSANKTSNSGSSNSSSSNSMKITRRKSADATIKSRRDAAVVAAALLIEEGRSSFPSIPDIQYPSSDRDSSIGSVDGTCQQTSSTSSTTKRNDRLWLLLFLVQLLWVFGCAATYGHTLLLKNVGGAVVGSYYPGAGATRRRHLLNLLSDSPVPKSPTSSTKSAQNTAASMSATIKPPPPPATAATATTLVMENNVSGHGIADTFAGITSNTPAPQSSEDREGENENENETDSTQKSQHDGDDEDDGNAVQSNQENQTSFPAPKSAKDSHTNTIRKPPRFTVDYKNVMSLVVISGVHATVAVYLGLAFMMIVQKSLIPVMLMSSLLMSLCWSVFGFALAGIAKDGALYGVSNLELPSYGIGLIASFGLMTFALTVAYTIASWNRVSFCSTNLYVAICAIRGCLPVLVAGVGALLVALGWVMIWSLALIGILNTNNFADCESWDHCDDTHVDASLTMNNVIGIIEIIFLSISFFWTLTVIQNAVGTYVSRAIGLWWKAPFAESPVARTHFTPGPTSLEENSQGLCFGRGWSDFTVASFSTYFGTVCFGSFILFPIQFLNSIIDGFAWVRHQLNDDTDTTNDSRKMASSPAAKNATATMLRRDDCFDGIIMESQSSEMTKLISRHQSLSSLPFHWSHIRRRMQTCNRWALTYVGMNNSSFLDGGEKALQLFEARGWMAIVKDSLTHNILLMGSIVIGGSTGALAVVVEELDGYMLTSLHKPIATSFWIGFLVGFVLSNVLLFGVVASAVNTVLVCFASEPFAFNQNHPQLSREMREVWSQQVWE